MTTTSERGKSLDQASARKQRHAHWRGAKLIIITLTLIVFIWLDGGGWRARSGRQLASQKLPLPFGVSMNNIDRLTDPRIPSTPTTNNTNDYGEQQQQRRPFILLASGAYLDSVGQLTDVMNEFVNSLLEKVSFLAEVVIESALEESCPSPFIEGSAEREADHEDGRSSSEAELNRTLNIDSAACRRFGAKHKLGNEPKQSLNEQSFDLDEFKNVNVFLDQYLGPNRHNPPSALNSRREGCKLFTLDVNSEDLPAEQMAFCCSQFHGCYNKCSERKSDCDRAFRRCLNGICRSQFNYKNETLLRQYAANLELAQKLSSGAGKRRRRHILSGVFSDQVDMGYEPMALDEPEGDDFELVEPVDSDSSGADFEPADSDGKRRRRRRGATESDEENEAGDQATGQSPDLDVDARTIKRLQDKYKACKLASKLLIIGNLAFGCQSYKQAQWRACCSSGNGGESSSAAS